jgi:Phosphotransferase enzyme family
MSAGRQGAHSKYAWLPVALPASARRIRVTDARLAETLAAAGAELVDERPDVEVAVGCLPRGDADHSLACFGRSLPERSRWTRLALRVAGSARAEVRARAARRALRRSGFPDPEILRWDENQRLGAHTLPGAGWKSRLPLGRIVVTRRDGAGPTQVEAAAAAAEIELEEPPEVRQGVVLARSRDGVLRIALGQPAKQLLDQREALTELGRAPVSPGVRRLVPWQLGSGRAGLAVWSLERRLPGAAPSLATVRRILPECVDFLVGLHRCRTVEAVPASLLPSAEVVAGFLPGAAGARAIALAARIEEAVAHLPRGFAHGDLCRENLLVDGDRLVGIVDWEAAGPGRLPGCDLFQLLATAERERRRCSLGEALLGAVLPALRAGGDDLTRSYCERTGVPANPEVLEALAIAGWLQYVAYQLGVYADRGQRPRWVYGNLHRVLDTLQPDATTPPRVGTVPDAGNTVAAATGQG